MAEYAPDGATLERFLNSTAFVRGIMGPVGSGKSTGCVVDLLDHSFEQAPGPDSVRRTRWAVVRNTYGELRTTALKTFEQWADPSWCRINTSDAPISARIRGRLEDRTLVDSEWLFVALDREEHVRKLLSLELTGAWLNEARELPRAVLMRMTERVGRFPPVRDGGPSWFGIVMDTNPPDTEHWFYNLAETDELQGPDFAELMQYGAWEFFRQPPGDSPEAENLSNLLPGYYERAKVGKTKDEINVYVRGQYGFVQEGRRVYEEYQDHMHCGDRELEASRDLPLLVGLDFGWAAAAVFVQRDARDRWVALDELVSEDLNTKAFAEAVVRKLGRDWQGYRVGGIWGDPAGLATSPLVSEDQANTHIDICRAAGLSVQPAPTNDQRLRHSAVGGLLSSLEGGVPRLTLHKRCVELRKGFNGKYRWPRRIVGGSDEAYGLTPVKNKQSHPHDALQYVILGGGEGQKVLQIEKPKKVIIPPTKRYGAWTRRVG
jgi:hypothetical protein